MKRVMSAWSKRASLLRSDTGLWDIRALMKIEMSRKLRVVSALKSARFVVVEIVRVGMRVTVWLFVVDWIFRVWLPGVALFDERDWRGIW